MIRALALGAALMLGACAIAPPMPSAVTDAQRLQRWQQHREAVAAIEAFRVDGRLAASTSPLSGRLRWLQAGNGDFDLFLSGPLGQGTLRLNGDPSAVRIRHADQDWVSRHPEQDLQASLGLPIPMQALRYWARGLPQPGVAARYDLDDDGRLLRLHQAGWHIDYDRYHPAAPALPARITLARDGTTLTLLADRWQPQDR